MRWCVDDGDGEEDDDDDGDDVGGTHATHYAHQHNTNARAHERSQITRHSHTTLKLSRIGTILGRAGVPSGKGRTTRFMSTAYKTESVSEGIFRRQNANKKCAVGEMFETRARHFSLFSASLGQRRIPILFVSRLLVSLTSCSCRLFPLVLSSFVVCGQSCKRLCREHALF